MDEKVSVNIQPIEEMIDRLSAKAVFGEPIHEGDVTLIPVARVTYGFGYGSGSGRGMDEEDTAAAGPAEGSGSGVGGGGMAKPQGFIRIDAEGVRYEPVADPARIPLAGVLMIAWNVFWITQAIRAFARKR